METFTREKTQIVEDIRLISEFVDKHGPERYEYNELLKIIKSIADKLRDKTYGTKELDLIIETFGETLSLETIQGHIHHKPHGYNGDFELMEKLYSIKFSLKPALIRWDLFWQSQNGSQAVRNRKEYFKTLLKMKSDRKKGTLHVLNIASGSCRDLYEFTTEFPDSDVHFDCIDSDKKSIHFAKTLNKKQIDKFRYFNTSCFKYKPDKQYDLIWSSGLLDYFTDDQFVGSISIWTGWLSDSGEICGGNFCEKNTMKDFMYLLDWKLFYRNKYQLFGLATQIVAGLNIEISVNSESEGVNLFLHLKKGKSVIDN